MKRILARAGILIVLLTLMSGCVRTVSVPPAPVANGYSSAADQTLGESLAALHAFVTQERVNYQALTADGQAREKTALNALIAAVNVADNAYIAFHAGTQTIQQAQDALGKAQTAQAELTKVKGVAR